MFNYFLLETTRVWCGVVWCIAMAKQKKNNFMASILEIFVFV